MWKVNIKRRWTSFTVIGRIIYIRCKEMMFFIQMILSGMQSRCQIDTFLHQIQILTPSRTGSWMETTWQLYWVQNITSTSIVSTIIPFLPWRPKHTWIGVIAHVDLPLNFLKSSKMVIEHLNLWYGSWYFYLVMFTSMYFPFHSSF